MMEEAPPPQQDSYHLSVLSPNPIPNTTGCKSNHTNHGPNVNVACPVCFIIALDM